jgi:hypothetical protein
VPQLLLATALPILEASVTIAELVQVMELDAYVMTPNITGTLKNAQLTMKDQNYLLVLSVILMLLMCTAAIWERAVLMECLVVVVT